MSLKRIVIKPTNVSEEKIRARLCNEVPVSKEQKLARKIETLTKEAQELHTEGDELHQKAEAFNTRASSTQSPSAPPPNRDPLFRAQGETAPPSQYEAELRAYNHLLEDWKIYEREVQKYEKRIKRFATSLKTARKKGGSKPGKQAFSQTDHEFESLTNALHNIEEQKAEIKRVVARVPLPASKIDK